MLMLFEQRGLSSVYSTAPAMSTECFLSYVPGTFGNVAAQEGKSLEEWQNELREEEVMKAGAVAPCPLRGAALIWLLAGSRDLWCLF